ncbi:uncharacterized protein B0I36DRAFT_30018 [Microdochium trichocladiopsis]|uniref:Uncharacterized protein n=1 Tax=Microdochium trichocladiopsis TaxID=1682393 RepID=A0A9P9BNU0_9PEZI|nr:uncharacterized protein B0I36DRAFT_30018 [Microdochium trichocladiopsis]KAH7021208.1 hypothetical protein B0I36DRAFT_30018 [Microdochium trichocladiopsis]
MCTAGMPTMKPRSDSASLRIGFVAASVSMQRPSGASESSCTESLRCRPAAGKHGSPAVESGHTLASRANTSSLTRQPLINQLPRITRRQITFGRRVFCILRGHTKGITRACIHDRKPKSKTGTFVKITKHHFRHGVSATSLFVVHIVGEAVEHLGVERAFFLSRETRT